MGVALALGCDMPGRVRSKTNRLCQLYGCPLSLSITRDAIYAMSLNAAGAAAVLVGAALHTGHAVIAGGTEEVVGYMGPPVTVSTCGTGRD